jgi:hypothetical protein
VYREACPCAQGAFERVYGTTSDAAFSEVINKVETPVLGSTDSSFRLKVQVPGANPVNGM